MKRAFFIRSVIFAGAGIVGMVAAAMAAPGDVAPDFALKSNTGRNIRLSELRGEVVLINFWATWCAGCREEMPKLDALYKRYRAAGFTVLGVNVDEKRAEAVAAAKAVTFPVLYDNVAGGSSDYSKFRVARLYRVRVMPITFLIDRDGRVRYMHEGYRSGDEEEYSKKVRELLKE